MYMLKILNPNSTSDAMTPQISLCQAVLEQHVMVLMKEAIAGRMGGRSGGRGSKSN